MKDGLDRVVNRGEFDRYIANLSNPNTGFHTIKHLQYDIDGDFINVRHFVTETDNRPDTNTVHDTRKGVVVFPSPLPQRRRSFMPMMFQR